MSSDASGPVPVDGLDGLPGLLLSALEQTRAAACITTADLDPPGPTIVYVNPAYTEMTGRPRDEVVGRTPRIMQGPLTDRAVLDRLRADLSAGRRFTGATVNYRADGTPFEIDWSIDPVRDGDGEIVNFVATQEDVTDRARADRLLQAEQRIDDALTSALSAERARDVAERDLIGHIAAGAETIAVYGRASVDVTIGGRAVVGPPDTRPYADGASNTVVIEGPSPLVEGTITITGLSDDELAFLDMLGLARYATRAGAVLAALAEYEHKRELAVRLQRELLPRPDPQASGFTVASRYVPGAFGQQVGGDWYDIVETDRRIVFSVGDVNGSGIEAAALMGRLRLLVDVELRRHRPIPDLMGLLDDVCRREAQLATLLFADYERSSGMISLWSAGHLPPVLRHGAQARLAEIRVAPPLGHLGERRPQPTTVELSPGAGLVLFTDGLVEQRDRPLDHTLDELVQLLSRAGSLTALVDERLATVAGEAADDVAVLVVQRAD